MAGKQWSVAQALFVALLTFSIACLWEFFLEGTLIAFHEEESTADHWEDIITSTLFVVIALVVPTWQSIGHERHRAQMERKIKSANALLQTLMDTIPNPIFYKDTQGIYTGCNKAFEEYVGLPKDKICGKSVYDIAPEELAEKYMEMDQKLYEEGGTQVYETQVRRADGSLQDVMFNKAVYSNPDGGLAGLVGVMLDITERKKVEEQVRETKLFLEKVMESATNAIYVIGLDGVFGMINKGGVEITGYDMDELVDQPFAILFEPETLSLVQEQFIKVAVHGQTVTQFETELTRKDGSKRFITFSIAPLYHEGRVANVVGTAEDITERKIASNELLRSKETAEKANDVKDKFVKLVAHDLRSPFTSMMGMLGLIKENRDDPVSEGQAKIIGHVLEAGERMVRMIEELLNITRLQTGDIVPRPSFFDGGAMAGFEVAKLAFHAEDKKIEIKNEIPEGMRLYADPILFGEVLQNLISNSIKFSRRGGTIRLFVPEDRPTTIAVSDTGIGFDHSMIPKIFRHDEKTTTLGTAGEIGTGLGLPLCHDIIAAHNGKLDAVSQKGEGSVFYVELPYVQPEILLVDDENIFRTVCKKMLEPVGAEIIDAENGQKAMDVLEQKTPHLIISDITMPVMDGFELLKNLKKDPRLAEIPVIVVTAGTKMDLRQRALRLGADDFSTKPMKEEDFIPRVRKFVV